jgi:hypothetical protein
MNIESTNAVQYITGGFLGNFDEHKQLALRNQRNQLKIETSSPWNELITSGHQQHPGVIIIKPLYREYYSDNNEHTAIQGQVPNPRQCTWSSTRTTEATLLFMLIALIKIS